MGERGKQKKRFCLGFKGGNQLIRAGAAAKTSGALGAGLLHLHLVGAVGYSAAAWFAGRTQSWHPSGTAARVFWAGPSHSDCPCRLIPAPAADRSRCAPGSGAARLFLAGGAVVLLG